MSSKAWRDSGLRGARERAGWAAAVLVGWAWLLACAPSPAIRDGRTHVLLVVIDTLRADHLSSYGHSHETSPHLDALAADGVRFSRYFSNAPWTRPAMASLLTGLHARSVGIYEERFDTLPEDVTTLAERMRARGYRTLGLTANPNVNAFFGFDQGFDVYEDSTRVWRWMTRQTEGDPVTKTQPLEGASVVTSRMLALVDAALIEAPEQPLYLQVLYIDPHTPWMAPLAHREAMRASRHREYDAEIHYVDAQVAKLLEGLRERGLLEDMLVVVTSDHGEGLDSHPGLPLSTAHGDHLNDASLKVPLILWHASLAPRVVDVLASSVDLLPTLADLLGWPLASKATAGRSLAASVRGGPTSVEERPVVSETDWRAARRLSVRTGDRRFVRADDARAWQQSGSHEGRRLDPERRRFLELPVRALYGEGDGDPAADRALREPDEARRLESWLLRWEEETPARPPIGRDSRDVVTLRGGEVVPDPDAAELERSLSPEIEEQLRALGYLDDRTPEEEASRR